MTPEQTTLSRALKALPGFEWEAGMLTSNGARIGLVTSGGIEFYSGLNAVWGDVDEGECLDLNDKGNGGILLDALRDDIVDVCPLKGGGWRVQVAAPSYRYFTAPTLAHAAALAHEARGYYRR